MATTGSSAPGLILQHEDAAPAALFADWCDRRGIAYEVALVWREELPTDPATYPWICTLGSEFTPGKAGAPDWVEAEVGFLRDAMEADVPILGLCFGGQALAAAAGADVVPAEPPEVGWFEIETANADVIPSGPWLYFHFDQFALPDGSVELARSPAGPAAFRLGPHLGLQFHPEATPAIADRWCEHEAEDLAPLGIAPAEVAEAGRLSATAAAEAAERLFDRWWASIA